MFSSYFLKHTNRILALVGYSMGRIEEAREGTTRRLSTPMKDSASMGPFGMKKFTGKV